MEKYICHVCKKEMDENTYWVSYLCSNCAIKIQSYEYLVGICPEHNTPQALIRLSKDSIKKKTQYLLMKECDQKEKEKLK